MNDHIATLRHMREWRAVCDSERDAIDAAIRALSADRGEAVGEVFNDCGANWINWLVDEQALPHGTKLYAATPPSSAEAIGGAVAVAWTTREQLKLLDSRKVKHARVWAGRNKERGDIPLYARQQIAAQANDVPVTVREWLRNTDSEHDTPTDAYVRSLLSPNAATPPSPAESAAPSQVSDAIAREYMQAAIGNLDSLLNAASDVRNAINAALAAQPQPGRVEGVEPLSAELVIDALLLVSDTDHITDEIVAAWTPEQCRRAFDWAMALHFRASDNDSVIVPPRPDFTRAPTAGSDA